MHEHVDTSTKRWKLLTKIKNYFNRFNSRLNTAEERINDLEDRSIESFQFLIKKRKESKDGTENPKVAG